MSEASSRSIPRITLTEWARHRIRGFSLGRNQHNCAACGRYLPLSWPQGPQGALCQACQDAGRVPRPPDQRGRRRVGDTDTTDGPGV